MKNLKTLKAKNPKLKELKLTNTKQMGGQAYKPWDCWVMPDGRGCCQDEYGQVLCK